MHNAATNTENALPKSCTGMYAMVSIFTATAKAAMTAVPKLLTMPCTSRMPKFMTDCCKQVQPDSERMLRRFSLFQHKSLRVTRYCGNFFRKYTVMPMPETHCEAAVASAAPIMPQCKTMTQYKSKKIFNTTETARNNSGMAEFPMPRRTLEK